MQKERNGGGAYQLPLHDVVDVDVILRKKKEKKREKKGKKERKKKRGEE